jgi:hypothetical protein
MMAAAEWYRKLITDFEAYRSGLRKAQMCGSDGCRPQTEHGCNATNFRCALLRIRLGSAMASALLAILSGAETGANGGAAVEVLAIFT